MIDFRLLRNRLFGVINLASLCGAAGFIGLLFAAPIYLQTARGVSAFLSGSSTAPEAVGVLVASQLAGRLYPRIGPRRLMMTGLFGVAAMTVLLTFVMQEPLWVFRAVMFAIGGGWGFVIISMNAGAMAQVSSRDTGRASALYNAQRQLAAALGVAILGTIVGIQTAGASAAAGTPVFRIAFLGSAAFAVAGGLVALWIRDRDAAATMRPHGAPARGEAETTRERIGAGV